MDGESSVRWHIYFSGRVQHVGFRYTAYYLAKSLYLTGWVDNLDDGRVEMEVQGPASRIRTFLVRLKGQAHIRISHLEVTQIPLRPHDRKFQVRGY